MRYYSITISPSSQSTIQFVPVTFSSLANNSQNYQNRIDNGSALRVDLDIFQNLYHQPSQNGLLTVHGVSFEDLNQSANYNNARIQISVGMSKGLPFADPKQAGEIIDGTILQCFGNWQGTEVNLNFVIVGLTYVSPIDEVNFGFTWKAGTTLENAIRQSLGIAYPNVPIYGSLSSNLIYNQDQSWQYDNITSFSKYINKKSKQIIKTIGYLGASIASTNQGFLITDGTAETNIVNVKFTDIIGNLTWIDVSTIQAKLVMRGDLNIMDKIVFPKGSPITNSPATFGQNRNNIAFQGVFQILNIRHVGNSRQADANSWCTIVDCTIPVMP